MLLNVERYDILEEIAAGGMATVYRARDKHLDRLVALKVLHPHLRSSNEARVRFTREARSVAKLRHPHVLEIYDYSGEDSDDSYIAAELLTGPTLKQLVTDGPDMPAEVAAACALQIARALVAAHEKGIVHRDVKPENVLVHEARLVKLTDFGIAHMVDTQSFTVTGQVLGSPGHMAPEQVEGGDCDERTDVFALGTVLYFLATARLPFVGKNHHQVLRRVVDCEYPDPLRIRPSMGNSLRDIIVRAMSKEPSARFSSACDFEAALLGFLAQSGVDDPDACLLEYLVDPVGSAEALRLAVVQRLTALGADAARQGDVPTALAHYNRVLALDDGNDEVLRLIQSIGRSEGRRRVALRAGAVAMAAAALGGLFYVATLLAPQPVRQAIREETGAAAGLTTSVASTQEPSRETDVDANPLSPAPARADAGAPAPDIPRRPRVSERTEPRAPRPTGPRTVVFQPNPQNVLIGVNGAPPRPFGPSFRSVALAPGRHRFHFVPGTDCCRELEFTQQIEPGEGPLVIRRTLPFEDARLYVVANVPGDVRIEASGGAPLHGRARDLIAIPMERLEVGARFTVTAPGHQDYTGQVRLRAGQVARMQVALEPVGSPP